MQRYVLYAVYNVDNTLTNWQVMWAHGLTKAFSKQKKWVVQCSGSCFIHLHMNKMVK